MDPVAGTDVCRQRVPREAARDAAKHETAYGDASPGVLDLILWLQNGDARTAENKAKVKDSSGANAGPWSLGTRSGHEVLLFQDSLYVPEDEALRQELMATYHDDPLAGHFGHVRSLELLRRYYNWPGVSRDVKEYVDTCAMCQRTKVHRHKPYGQLQSLPIPKSPWKEIAMDFITGLPRASVAWGLSMQYWW